VAIGVLSECISATSGWQPYFPLLKLAHNLEGNIEVFIFCWISFCCSISSSEPHL